MLNKINLKTWILILMITFFQKSEANYDKIFFDMNIKSIEGNKIDFSKYRNKTVLLVNVASKCGFTKQYSDLQSIYETYKDRGLIILGVPSNQFGGQEPRTNSEINNFCKTNFNITFQMTDKVDVKGENAHEIYIWAKRNFGNSAIPKWNFHKILINKDGKIEETYGSFVKPTSKKITRKLEELLN